MQPLADHDPLAMGLELESLVQEERRLSTLRRRLHAQIDNGFPNGVVLRRERRVSDERRALHLRIDRLHRELAS